MSFENCTPEDLAKRVQLPLSAVNLILALLDGSEKCTPQKRSESKPRSGGDPKKSRSASEADWSVAEARIRTALLKRPKPKPEFDQCHATQETIITRVRLMWDRLDIQRKRILVLGDDDFLSIALALLGAAEEITVLELDPEVVGALRQISATGRLGVKVYNGDYREQLHENLKRHFDVVFADPPYTLAGLSVCMERAVEALKPGPGRRIYLCFSPMDLALQALSRFQREVNELGLVFLELYPNFNRYNETEAMNEEVLQAGYKPTKGWFSSSLARFSTAKKPAFTKKAPKDIYQYEAWD